MTPRNRTFAVLPGTVVPGPTASTVVFAVVTLWWLAANAHLLENVRDGPFYGLFLELAIIRVATGLITLFVVLCWYLLRLNGLNHEAMAQ